MAGLPVRPVERPGLTGEPANHGQLRLDRQAILDLLEARELIEPHLAQTAARRADPAQLAELATSLDRVTTVAGDRKPTGDRATGDLATGELATGNFHQALARVAGNQALARVLESLMASYDQEQRHILALYGERDTDQQAHREILAAVCGRRAVRARRLMREHLHDVRTVVSAALGVPDLR